MYADELYLDGFPRSLHEVSPLLKLIVTKSEFPRVRFHNT